MVTLDMELGVVRKRLSSALYERKVIPKFIELFERYEIPATWAVVGHLLLSDCNKKDLPFKDCSDPKWRDVLYTPDLINRILDSPIPHEIASHSFSHINYGTSPLEDVKRDLELSIEALKEFNIKPMSFIFPRNDFTHESLKAVREAGFKTTRVDMDFKEDVSPLRCITALMSITPEIPLNFLSGLIDVLKDEDVIFHIWTHPYRWRRLYILEKMFKKIRREDIPSITMKDGYDFELPYKDYVFVDASSFPGVYYQGALHFEMYHANLTLEKKCQPLRFPLSWMNKITRSGISDVNTKKVGIENGMINMEGKTIGHGSIHLTIPVLVRPISKFLYEISRAIYLIT